MRYCAKPSESTAQGEAAALNQGAAGTKHRPEGADNVNHGLSRACPRAARPKQDRPRPSVAVAVVIAVVIAVVVRGRAGAPCRKADAPPLKGRRLTTDDFLDEHARALSRALRASMLPRSACRRCMWSGEEARRKAYPARTGRARRRSGVRGLTLRSPEVGVLEVGTPGPPLEVDVGPHHIVQRPAAPRADVPSFKGRRALCGRAHPGGAVPQGGRPIALKAAAPSVGVRTASGQVPLRFAARGPRPAV